MTQSKILGKTVIKIMKENGLRQQDLARILHIDRTTLSKYLNGHLRMPGEIEKEIVDYLHNPILRIMVYGTTSSNIIFDQVKIEFYRSAVKAIEEFEEAIESIKLVLDFAYNFDSISDLNENQLEKFKKMLEEVEDANHGCDMLDIAAAKLGANLEERNKKCYKKYINRGYLTALEGCY